MRIEVTLTGTDEQVHVLSGEEGQTLKDLAKDAGVEGVQGLCGGEASCGTCQIAVDRDWHDKLPPIEEAEQDMLGFSADPDIECVRLSCQIRLAPSLHGLKAIVVEG